MEEDLDPEGCEKFLMVHSRILHPQHAHMLGMYVLSVQPINLPTYTFRMILRFLCIFLDVKHSLLHLLGHCEGYLMADLTEKQLQLKEDTARCILNVANKVIPGTYMF